MSYFQFDPILFLQHMLKIARFQLYLRAPQFVMPEGHFLVDFYSVFFPVAEGISSSLKYMIFYLHMNLSSWLHVRGAR